jgi:hypothetical protein
MTKITLTRPIKAQNESLTELTLREPNAGDLFRCGIPYKVEAAKDGSVRTVFDAGAVRALTAALAGIPTSSVDQLSAADFMACCNACINFTDATAPETS